jgi:hypothetical protein
MAYLSMVEQPGVGSRYTQPRTRLLQRRHSLSR